MPELPVAVIGAGPAGLTAAYALAKAGGRVTVLEADPVHVGGIARTARYKGYHFDIGGHRFFSKSQEVEELWTEILPNDLLERPRSSRIFYDGEFYSYPLKGLEALHNLGIVEAVRCAASYAHARLFPTEKPRNLQEWVTNQFGSRLFRIFFKTYTEKVWGIPCTEISADWAAQRIQGLSLAGAVRNALSRRKRPPGIASSRRSSIHSATRARVRACSGRRARSTCDAWWATCAWAAGLPGARTTPQPSSGR
jgi:protoporphyrinogen oxidase